VPAAAQQAPLLCYFAATDSFLPLYSGDSPASTAALRRWMIAPTRRVGGGPGIVARPQLEPSMRKVAVTFRGQPPQNLPLAFRLRGH
jgi:hypothetical protein